MQVVVFNDHDLWATIDIRKDANIIMIELEIYQLMP